MKWIGSILSERHITTLAGAEMSKKATRGTSEEVKLSPLIWNMKGSKVVDELPKHEKVDCTDLNFEPELGPEQNSQPFSRVRNSSQISRRPGIRNGIRNSAGNLENKCILKKRLHMIFLLKAYTVDGFILILKSVLSNS